MNQTDPVPVFNTLKFWGRQMRVQQFKLKKFLRAKKEAEQGEADTRRILRQIKDRIQFEIDRHPEIVAKFTGSELEDD